MLPITGFADYWVKFNFKISNIIECPKDFENIILNAVGRDLIHTRQNLLASKEKQKQQQQNPKQTDAQTEQKIIPKSNNYLFTK